MDGAGPNSAGPVANSSSDFVRKLYKMLEDPSYGQVVRWGNEGNSFVVLENERFTKSILPKHFKHSNFASFVRQLNKYDFHKVRHTNEENGQSQYGANVWEFKHPEFKMNGKDSLENIRRKAPATRKSLQNSDDLPPTQQIDMVNGQLVAMQQQLQQLSDRYNDLSAHHALLLSELMGLQKTVVNHENVMQNVMTYLHTADSFIRDQQRNSRVRTAFAGVPEGEAVSTEMNPPAKHISPVGTTLPSPLQNADKLLHDSSTETLLNNKTLEQMNELYKQMNGAANTPSPRTIISGHGAGLASQRAPAGPEGGLALDYTKLNCDFQDAVYPAGHNNGIDPLFSEHINNIPYSMPTGKDISPTDPRKQFSESRKKSSTIDPGWIRRPQILLVEDDPTCRRIGGKFLYSFKCAIDSALDGLEAVNKMNGGSKYDLVLMDIIMPNLDGISACHLIRQFDSTPIIAMTSNIRSDDIAMYFAHGMNDVLPKPFTKEGLLTMLEKHLAHLKESGGSEQLPTQQLTQASARQSIKDDSSSVRSPATTSNWQSPTQITGISPQSHGLPEEYVTAISRTTSYSIDSTLPSDNMAFHQSPEAPLSSRSTAHRRQISQVSDVSGSDEMMNEAKRQRSSLQGWQAIR